jgi:hypothetical protein
VGLITPPSPRNLSADSNRLRRRRKRSSSSRRGRSASRGGSAKGSIDTVFVFSSNLSKLTSRCRVTGSFGQTVLRSEAIGIHLSPRVSLKYNGILPPICTA